MPGFTCGPRVLLIGAHHGVQPIFDEFGGRSESEADAEQYILTMHIMYLFSE